jgi:ABC-type glycerol-3-phosphate transport system substrate-binding protein
MLKAITVTLALLTLAACSGAPADQQDGAADPFIVMTSVTDQANNAINLNVRMNPPATQENAKRIAEKAISRYKDQYRNVTIKGYFGGMDPSQLPYVESKLENGVIRHQFFPQAVPQKIPTH